MLIVDWLEDLFACHACLHPWASSPGMRHDQPSLAFKWQHAVQTQQHSMLQNVGGVTTCHHTQARDCRCQMHMPSSLQRALVPLRTLASSSNCSISASPCSQPRLLMCTTHSTLPDSGQLHDADHDHEAAAQHMHSCSHAAPSTEFICLQFTMSFMFLHVHTFWTHWHDF